MNPTTKVKDYYNEGQSGYEVLYIEKGIVGIVKIINGKTSGENSGYIGFYEWLFNPKYKVFEVFDIIYIKTSMFYEVEGEREKIIIRQPEEIIKYLAQGVKENN